MKKTIIYSLPYFSAQFGDQGISTPKGYELFFESIRRKLRKKALTGLLQNEYMDILHVLKIMGYSVKVFMAPGLESLISQSMFRLLKEVGVDFIYSHPINLEKVRQTTKVPFMYPRDAWVDLSEYVLVKEDIAESIPFLPASQKLSVAGEGGMVFTALGYVFMPEYHDYLTFTNLNHQHLHSSVLQADLPKDLKLICLPNAVTYYRDEKQAGYVHEIHLDRNYCLIKDSQGELHLIMDPYMQSFKDINKREVLTRGATQEKVKRLCTEYGITLHIPKELKVPTSICVPQFHNGRVLLTSGEPLLQNLLVDLLGKENVFTTKNPILAYPVFAKAGIRCLVNEL